jgi:hypothetical protein
MAKVDIDRAAVAAFFRETDGPLARHMLVLGERIKLKTISLLSPKFAREFLGPTIVKRMSMQSDGPHIMVGTDKTKTAPHPIDGNPLLVFNWKKMGGQLMFLRHVNHPGSEFRPYLEKKLAEALAEVNSF